MRRRGQEEQLWSDGIHFVRRATHKDRHPMRFVATTHKGAAPAFQRHLATQEEAIEAAHEASKRYVSAGNDRPSLEKGVAPPEASSTQLSDPQGPNDEAKRSRFSTTRFDCVHANPVAQVWLCTSDPGEKKPVGRRKAGGRAPEQAQVPHRKGQCAIMVGNLPFRCPDGSVRVYPNRFLAEEEADLIYVTTPEDDTISWKSGHSRVASSENFEVHFNPESYGFKHPFIIWFPRVNRPVYVDTERTIAQRPGIALKDIENPQVRLDLEAARARARAEQRTPAFEERAKTFRSIWEAIAEMDRREKMLRGETVR